VPLTQSPSTLQLVRHAAPDGAHVSEPGHAMVVGVAHDPVPLHMDMGVSVAFVHDCVPHGVLLGAYRQPPVPSQRPSWPQGGASVVQALDGVPAVVARHRPFAWPVADIAQAWQVPAQALSQQTLPTQWLLAHWLLPLQLAPSIFLAMQVVDAQ
jgi:hypothetical protein